MAILPLVMTDQGLQPALPADLRAQLIALVSASNPDYTANLPASLIEDISSTDTYALVVTDSFLVDLINSVTPFGANAFLLNQLGIMYGVDHQGLTNTSVNVVFVGPPGYPIAQGFTVSDGQYQYVCQTGGICGIDGLSLPIYCLATVTGAWPVLANTVSQLVTSVPSGIDLSVSNPVAGIPSSQGEPISVYRSRCFTAGLAASTGMARFLKTLLANVPGVQNRLISIQQSNDKFIVIVGGGDPYQVGYAIWSADFYTPGLSGADIQIINIASTNPAIITTSNRHNLSTGDIETLTEIVGLPFLNNQTYAVTVIDGYNFSIPIDGTTWGTYQFGGIVSPNPLNASVTISDYPDSFLIPFVVPFQEDTTIIVTWKTNSPNYVSPAGISQAATPAIIDYINSLPAGVTPINLNVLTTIFLNSISSILAAELVIDLQFTISVNGLGVLPEAGTQIIPGDPYGYFYTDTTMVIVTEVP